MEKKTLKNTFIPHPDSPLGVDVPNSMYYLYDATLIDFIDADTVDVLTQYGLRQKGDWKLRLFGIDTPEKYEPGFQEANNYFLSRINIGDRLLLRTIKDRYGSFSRILAVIHPIEEDGTVAYRSLNQEMVDAGVAVYSRLPVRRGNRDMYLPDFMLPGNLTTPEELMEEAADLCHEQWAGWMRHLFTQGHEQEDGSVLITPEHVERWKHQTTTAYKDLSPQEQESDRTEAKKFLGLMGGKHITGE